MFKSLRDKFSSWLKKPKEETVVVETKKKGKKKEKAKKPVKEKKKKEPIQEPEKEQIMESPKEELPIKEKIEEPIKEPIKEEKKGFLKRLFSKKEKTEEAKQEEIPEKQIQVQETIIESQTHEEEPSFFSKLAHKLSTSTLTQEQFDSLFPELEMTLLENNVALEVVDKIHDSLSKDLVGIEVKKSQVQETIINSLKESILNILIEPPDLIQKINSSTGIFTIIFVGINGSGKTTSLAKLAHYLKQHNISSVLAAGDTFRAASIEQLKEHGNKLNIPVIANQYGSDPAAVAFDAKKYAKAHNIKAVLIDTAGRMYTKTNLIKEMEKIVRVSSPDLKIFVGESITGNDATEQAKTFNEAINIDGIILTKADVDEKAGTILSVSAVTNKPIYFLGVGQSYSDLTPFKKSTILKNLGLE